MREYSEEFLGNAEHGGDEAGADYTIEPLVSLDRARQEGKIRVYAIGIRVGALDLWSSLETVAVIDGDAFDEIFADAVTTNDEGTLVQTGTAVPSILIPFTETTIKELFAADRLAGETRFNLDRSWRHRDVLLS
ncbi:MAG: helix-turn-helix domain-containing protein, partial [Acidimicrobiales bacterium]